MSGWVGYAEAAGKRPHTVVGTVRLQGDVYSAQLGNERDILVYLPPSYDRGTRRYPVLYMQDGQNLFDRFTSFAGEWQVDESMERLSQEGLEAIVVGIPNMGTRRIHEYTPFPGPHDGGGGDRYLEFLCETLKPMIDRDFRTMPEREHTGLLGSSMGGLISLYGFFRRPEVFGFAGAMSPSIWYADQGILRYIEQTAFSPGRIYLDMGCLEGRPSRWRDRLLCFCLQRGPLYDARRAQRLLKRRGYRPGTGLRYVEDPAGTHNEAAWARRFPDAMRFFLGP